ncbi:unnamed protein product [Bursaphelenchus xylophilus]|uniref:(pine wood nematode) hypothetical protein n=1 Tax=Bursaphelenchus xylophilus TaxID=6326 RepID=A0A1I7SRQ2_BURXY|nr:unnamed protein product [Bursaphelenchus xylophilus]CAG9102006.1 unnamed protein product [Bursaphelenchus xylophilus]
MVLLVLCDKSFVVGLRERKAANPAGVRIDCRKGKKDNQLKSANQGMIEMAESAVAATVSSVRKNHQKLMEQAVRQEQLSQALAGNESLVSRNEHEKKSIFGSLLAENILAIEEDEAVCAVDFSNLMKFYSGEGEETFAEFIQKFEDFAAQQSTVWDDKTKLAKLKLLLTGEARERFETACQGSADALTYADAKKNLLQSYKLDSEHSEVLSELHSIRQGDGESVDDFYVRVKKMVSRLMPDSTPEALKSRCKEEFVFRSRDEISKPVQRVDVPTLEAARQRVRTIESSLRRSELQRTEDALRKLGLGVNAAMAVPGAAPPVGYVMPKPAQKGLSGRYRGSAVLVSNSAQQEPAVPRANPGPAPGGRVGLQLCNRV